MALGTIPWSITSAQFYSAPRAWPGSFWGDQHWFWHKEDFTRKTQLISNPATLPSVDVYSAIPLKSIKSTSPHYWASMMTQRRAGNPNSLTKISKQLKTCDDEFHSLQSTTITSLTSLLWFCISLDSALLGFTKHFCLLWFDPGILFFLKMGWVFLRYSWGTHALSLRDSSLQISLLAATLKSLFF